MIQTTCIKINKDRKGRIETYELIDEHGNRLVLDSNNIKMNMNMGNLVVDNLKISIDGRLLAVKIGGKKK